MAGVEVAQRAPEAVSAKLEDVVQQVFVDGLHSAVWVAVAVTAAAAAAAVGLLRGAPRVRTRTRALWLKMLPRAPQSVCGEPFSGPPSGGLRGARSRGRNGRRGSRPWLRRSPGLRPCSH